MKRVRHVLIDDLDGTELPEGSGETISFALDGTGYVIDLSGKNAKFLRDTVAPYIAAGTLVARGVVTGPGTRRSAVVRSIQERDERRKLRAEVAAWLLTKGIVAPDRGRIKEQHYEEYREARRVEALKKLNAPPPPPKQRRIGLPRIAAAKNNSKRGSAHIVFQDEGPRDLITTELVPADRRRRRTKS